MKRLAVLLILIIAAVALAALVALFYPITGYPSGQMEGPPAFVEELEIQIMESFPVQVRVFAKGYLPNPCTRIGRIDVARTVYGDFDITINTVTSQEACVQTIQPFEETIPLNVTGYWAGTYRVTANNPDNSTTSASFTLQHDNFVKVLRACSATSDCELPMRYAIQSNCPFGAACIDDECRVICPLTFHDPDPNVSQSYPVACQEDSDCDCTERADRSLDCMCLNGACVSVEY